MGGATVSVARTGCSTTGWSDKTVTAADGSWSVIDPAAPGGACSHSAAYAGTSTYGSSTARTSVQVAFRTTDLTLTVVRGTGSTKKYAYVTGHLGAWHNGKTLRITAQPTGGTEILLASGTVDSAGKLTATYQPKTTTTYRVTYAGNDWYAAAESELRRRQSVSSRWSDQIAAVTTGCAVRWPNRRRTRFAFRAPPTRERRFRQRRRHPGADDLRPASGLPACPAGHRRLAGLVG
jgi:hypothetical protein